MNCTLALSINAIIITRTLITNDNYLFENSTIKVHRSNKWTPILRGNSWTPKCLNSKLFVEAGNSVRMSKTTQRIPQVWSRSLQMKTVPVPKEKKKKKNSWTIFFFTEVQQWMNGPKMDIEICFSIILIETSFVNKNQ